MELMTCVDCCTCTVVSRRGRDATIGEEVFARESEEARMAALSNAYRVVPLRHFFYVSLKHMVGDKERIDACLKVFRVCVTHAL